MKLPGAAVHRLEVEGLHVDLGSRPILSDVTMRVGPGEVVALIGANGAGKTTLMRAIAGLVVPSKGCLRFDGRSYDAASVPRTIGACIGSPTPISWMSPRSFARMLVDSTGEPGASERADAALDEVGLETALWTRRFARLSQGQRALALLACSLLRSPTLLLLDEPFAHLDERHAAGLEAMVRLRVEAGAAVLYSCHHAGDLAIAQRSVALAGGAVCGSWPAGDPAALAHVR